ncbi:MAG: hypothetical protein M9916_06470 [Crocinitomicaceae bacterium]|nr:hypothetical protein [Crocinitomicaceae bacterium]
MFGKKYRHIIHRFVVVLSLMAFLITNVGMVVYTHSCIISGTEKTLFASNDDPCEQGHQQKEEEKTSCCAVQNAPIEHSDANNHQEVHKKCCSNNTDYISLGIDILTGNYDSQIAILPFDLANVAKPVFAYDITLNTLHHSTNSYVNSPPTPYQGRALQNIHQVYII